MLQSAWEEIESIYIMPAVDPLIIKQFQDLKNTQDSHTKGEGNSRHYCSFFLPFDEQTGKIYLGHHKKADDWIPPGGHIEPGETPTDATIREMKEELGVDITKDLLTPFNLSVKPISQIGRGCMTHHDVWHLVSISEQNFNYLKSEYHDAGWFGVQEGVKKITKNPDFANIIRQLL